MSGSGTSALYGGAFQTPHIDALAAGGTRFEHCYATPLCGPSRATCLTGRYVFRTGMRTNTDAHNMSREEIMVPAVLKPAGYVTASVGKWSQVLGMPADWGFDEHLHFPASGLYWASQGRGYQVNGAKKELRDRYLPDVMHEFLVDFITRHKGEPFYVHYALSHMHRDILRTPDSKPGGQSDETELYADNNAYMDKLVGQLVAALDRLGLREKTLLVFVGDNGTADQGSEAATVNGRALSGKKGTMLEGGSRVPMIVNWPGTTPAGRVLKDLTDFTDFLPTFADLAGAKLPEVKLDGHSFAAQIKGQPGTPREWAFVQLGAQWFAREQGWKLNELGELFDMSGAPFAEKPVAISADTDASRLRVRV